MYSFFCYFSPRQVVYSVDIEWSTVVVMWCFVTFVLVDRCTRNTHLSLHLYYTGFTSCSVTCMVVNGTVDVHLMYTQGPVKTLMGIDTSVWIFLELRNAQSGKVFWLFDSLCTFCCFRSVAHFFSFYVIECMLLWFSTPKLVTLLVSNSIPSVSLSGQQSNYGKAPKRGGGGYHPYNRS